MGLIGYARVSTEDQSTKAQRLELEAAGCTLVYEETGSGGSRARPELEKLLRRIGPGDVLVVSRIDRLARSLSHLLEVIEGLKAVGAHFRSLHDPIDTSTPQGKFALQVLGAAAELERELIRERTRAGLRAARLQGRKGGNPGLRQRDPAALRKLSAARRARHLSSVIGSADSWLPTVRRLRPETAWEDVARVLNASLPEGSRWSVDRLVRATRALVREGLAEPELLGRAKPKRRVDRLVILVAGIRRANPTLSLRAIATQLEAMRERAPRGARRWHPSSVRHLIEKADKAGLLGAPRTDNELGKS